MLCLWRLSLFSSLSLSSPTLFFSFLNLLSTRFYIDFDFDFLQLSLSSSLPIPPELQETEGENQFLIIGIVLSLDFDFTLIFTSPLPLFRFSFVSFALSQIPPDKFSHFAAKISAFSSATFIFCFFFFYFPLFSPFIRVSDSVSFALQNR
ncbi:hypothetical protein VNO77_12583 [Canavalia gladiata]|uniref:Uncharacterized protein n=1 Tax=Canavalia gladiata TaxID=3824 RepID=A0AAN9LWY8_CANGL